MTEAFIRASRLLDAIRATRIETPGAATTERAGGAQGVRRTEEALFRKDGWNAEVARCAHT
ncbi:MULTISPECIES: hypothetical protein [Streptomyces]|uniref:hypothetical protein n=1 Tax=Streptomyces TaxID=1883 RepID=UPI00131DC1E1|nr:MULTISPECIES: hypothetical protein [Streptomyces]